MHHHHHHNEEKSDIWTKLSATSGVSTYISDTYWFATLFDFATGLEGDVLPISWYALGVGAFIAALSASGSTYCHWVLNKNHQHSEHDSDERLQSNESTILINHQTEEQEQDQSTQGLAFIEKAALVGDFISHTGEVAGPITFVVDLASKSNLPQWANIVKHSGATLFGIATSIADVRTCYENLKKSHHPKKTM